MRTLGLVPARSGSRRLPGKNLAQVNGKSLVRIAAECGLSVLDNVIVSTDSEEIWLSAAPADGDRSHLHWHQRDPALARDDTSTMSVVYDVIRTTNLDWDVLVLLQPTSPLRTPDDVRAVLRIMQKADAVVSLREDGDIKKTGLFQLGLGHRLRPVPLLPGEHAKANGAVYAMTRAKLELHHDWDSGLPEQSYGYLMPASRSVDIDTAEDLALARAHAAMTAEVA